MSIMWILYGKLNQDLTDVGKLHVHMVWWLCIQACIETILCRFSVVYRLDNTLEMELVYLGGCFFVCVDIFTL